MTLQLESTNQPGLDLRAEPERDALAAARFRIGPNSSFVGHCLLSSDQGGARTDQLIQNGRRTIR